MAAGISGVRRGVEGSEGIHDDDHSSFLGVDMVESLVQTVEFHGPVNYSFRTVL